MSAEEQVFTLTTAAPSIKVALDGPHRVDLIGTFGGGTITHYSFTNAAGRGAAVHAVSTVDDAYASQTPYSEFVIAGSTGATVQAIFTPIINKTLGG